MLQTQSKDGNWKDANLLLLTVLIILGEFAGFVDRLTKSVRHFGLRVWDRAVEAGKVGLFSTSRLNQ